MNFTSGHDLISHILNCPAALSTFISFWFEASQSQLYFFYVKNNYVMKAIWDSVAGGHIINICTK